MRHKIDMNLTGQRFGKLTLLKCMDEKPSYFSKYLCRCDCGNEIEIPYYGFFRGRASCGCDKIEDLTGKQYGMLTVESRAGEADGFSTRWLCRCACGNTALYPTLLLKNGLATSCGCQANPDLVELRAVIEGTNRALLQSAMDGVLYENNTTGVRGVYYQPRQQTYRANIIFKSKRLFLGDYKKLEDAAKARKRAEELIYGEWLDHYHTNLEPGIKAQKEQETARTVEAYIEANPPQIPQGRTGIPKNNQPTGRCIICGKELPKGRWKYCSIECGQKMSSIRNYERRKRTEEIFCAVCGKPVPRNRTRYCSNECHAIGVQVTRVVSNVRGVAKGKYEIVCADCGRKVMVASPKSYRCAECQKEAKKLQNLASKNRETRKIGSTGKCERCGKEYVVKGATQKYCELCGPIAVAEATKRSAERNKKEVVEKKKVCRVCGETFYSKTKAVYCSPECREQGLREQRKAYWREYKR